MKKQTGITSKNKTPIKVKKVAVRKTVKKTVTAVAKKSAVKKTAPKKDSLVEKKAINPKQMLSPETVPLADLDAQKVPVSIAKPKIAIVSLTSCEGCQFVLLDLGQRFLELAEKVEMVDFRLIEDEEDPGQHLDIVFIEGNPVTKDNVRTLIKARNRSKTLVALGNCAAMGGIPEIKNYTTGANPVKHVYRYLQGIDNPPIKEIDNFVQVDFTLPGCPINGEEFLKYLPELLAGRIPVIADLPVCVECRRKGNVCLLTEKKPCFGPMILGGCDAVCPTSRMMCQGCRGLRPTGNVTAMRGTLKTLMTDEEFENTTEIYGLRDDIEAQEKKKKIV